MGTGLIDGDSQVKDTARGPSMPLLNGGGPKLSSRRSRRPRPGTRDAPPATARFVGSKEPADDSGRRRPATIDRRGPKTRLQTQDDHRRSTALPGCRCTIRRSPARLQHAQPHDRAWATGVVRDRELNPAQTARLPAHSDPCNNAPSLAQGTRPLARVDVKAIRSSGRCAGVTSGGVTVDLHGPVWAGAPAMRCSC